MNIIEDFNLNQTDIDRPYLEKQVKLYLQVQSKNRKNDLLYRMGTNAEVLTFDDIVVADRNEGLLNQEQRQRVIEFINHELKTELANWIDLPTC